VPGEINQRVEAKERGANVLRDIARLLARQAAVEAVKTSKATLQEHPYGGFAHSLPHTAT